MEKGATEHLELSTLVPAIAEVVRAQFSMVLLLCTS